MKIKGKEYDLVFGFSALRKLEEMWGCKTINEVLKKLEPLQRGEFTTSHLLDLMKAGLARTPLTEDDILDYLDSFGIDLNPLTSELLNAFAASLPKHKKKT